MREKREMPLNLSQALMALDSAVAAACEELLPPEECANPSVAVRLENGLQSLRRLASGGSPDWQSRETAVLYSSWYQLGHVNLAYNVARVLVEQWTDCQPNEETLHIVDFGAGTSALPIAFELLGAREPLPGKVVLHLVERSRVVLEHGNRIFEKLRDELETGNDTASLTVTHPNGKRAVPRLKSMFCLMHSVYPGDEDMKRRVKGFVSRCSPFYGIATCNQRKVDVLSEFEGLLLASSFKCNDVKLSCVPDVQRTEFQKTQRYRNNLLKFGINHFSNPTDARRLLTRDVPLWPWQPTVREYALRV